MEIRKLINQKIKIILMSKNNYTHSKKFSHSIRAQKILNESGVSIIPAVGMKNAAEKVVKAALSN